MARTPLRPWIRLLSAWAFVALVGSGACRTLEVSRLGWSDSEGVLRVASSIEREFASAQARLHDASDRIAELGTLVTAAADDHEATRQLFGHLDAATAHAEGVAITLYTRLGVPLAWSGRPTDLPRQRLNGTTTTFVAPGPMGPRLFLARPVMADRGIRADGSIPRVATVVAEWPLPTASPTEASDAVVWTQGPLQVRLRPRYEGADAADTPGKVAFTAADGSVLLDGRVKPEDVAAARQQYRRQLRGFLILLTAICALAALAPALTWRRHKRGALWATTGTSALVVLTLGARLAAWYGLPLVMSVSPTPSQPAWLFRTPIDFLLTATAALTVAAIALGLVSRARYAGRAPRRSLTASGLAFAGHLSVLVLGGVASLGVALGMLTMVSRMAQEPALESLSFSLHHGDLLRTCMEAGLVLASAAATWFMVAILRTGSLACAVDASPSGRLAAAGAWLAAPMAWTLSGLRPSSLPVAAILVPSMVGVVLALAWIPLARAYRHASQATRIMLLFAALAVPAVGWYPTMFAESDTAQRVRIASRFAPEALRQRDNVQARVRQALTEIDTITGLADLAQAAPALGAGAVPTEAAFHVWSRTGLGRARLTSAIEVYGPDRLLVSRFALKLPDYTSTQQRWDGTGCGWELYEEVSPFFSEERRLLYAGRGICVDGPEGPRMVGAIALYAMLDYGDLSFIAAQNPYSALVRPQTGTSAGATTSRRLDFVVYGWSRTPVYASGAAWTLDETTFRRVYRTRTPFWTTLYSAGEPYAVYLGNDRGGIYALGFQRLTSGEHLVNLAELVVLSGMTFVALVALSWVSALITGYRGATGRELLREIRASFYRKLFLAFVAAAVFPVMTLAVAAQAYLTSRLLADIEAAAVRTASVAQRVVEDYAQLQERGERRVDTVDDDILVWIARVIDQDVNVFDGPVLMATSERSLYASGVLPTRTSADTYRAIALDRQAAYVGRERLGPLAYLAASAPVRLGGREAILTVPLTLRQQAIEQEIDDLNRRILLAVLAFILAGSALGYWMAERIADPVNRLQRATTRIARGDLTVRVALTSSDELRRLVETFNGMAAELQRQQSELARVYRLEAWADMARQVAHDIKNPLTPIQLSAEHLRRVHADRGLPLSPVLESCVDSILTQVRLLRQIAGEFSSFASAPVARPVATDIGELLHEVVDPYKPGLVGRVDLELVLEADLPIVTLDRTLVGRAMTNVLDNALHAMPNGGRLTVAAAQRNQALAISVTDTGMGMDAAAVARIFEPYFSTKATGTGLGLTIAKRNVELNGGNIAVHSEPRVGTTVTLVFPLAART